MERQEQEKLEMLEDIYADMPELEDIPMEEMQTATKTSPPMHIYKRDGRFVYWCFTGPTDAELEQEKEYLKMLEEEHAMLEELGTLRPEIHDESESSSKSSFYFHRTSHGCTLGIY